MNDLLSRVERLGRPRILVVGDLILDRYTRGKVDRVSPEAPVVILHRTGQDVRLGGAASVAGLLRGLDAAVGLVGVVGDDPDGRALWRLLDAAGIDHASVLTTPGRPTTTKERFVGQTGSGPLQQLLRVDHEVCDPLPDEVEHQLLVEVAGHLDGCQALLVSDYAKGVCTVPLLQGLLNLAVSSGVPVLIDPARTGDYGRYRQARLLTPNRTEAERASGMSIVRPEDALLAGRHLLERAGVAAVLVKLDRDGMALVRDDAPPQFYPTRPCPVRDVTGAGDMVLAMAGLCQAEGLSWDDTVRLANVAAGLEVQRPGVMPISRAEVCAALRQGGPSAAKRVTREQMVELALCYWREGKTVVFTNGCFDLLHVGHTACLEEAARLGDVLVVAVNSDRSVRRLKGPDRPLIPQEDRANLVAALGCVSHVLVFDEETPVELLRQLCPDVLVKGGPYRVEEIVGREVVEAYRGTVCVTHHVEGISTTRLLAALRAARSRAESA